MCSRRSVRGVAKSPSTKFQQPAAWWSPSLWFRRRTAAEERRDADLFCIPRAQDMRRPSTRSPCLVPEVVERILGTTYALERRSRKLGFSAKASTSRISPSTKRETARIGLVSCPRAGTDRDRPVRRARRRGRHGAAMNLWAQQKSKRCWLLVALARKP